MVYLSIYVMSWLWRLRFLLWALLLLTSPLAHSFVRFLLQALLLLTPLLVHSFVRSITAAQMWGVLYCKYWYWWYLLSVRDSGVKVKVRDISRCNILPAETMEVFWEHVEKLSMVRDLLCWLRWLWWSNLWMRLLSSMGFGCIGRISAIGIMTCGSSTKESL